MMQPFPVTFWGVKRGPGGGMEVTWSMEDSVTITSASQLLELMGVIQQNTLAVGSAFARQAEERNQQRLLADLVMLTQQTQLRELLNIIQGNALSMGDSYTVNVQERGNLLPMADMVAISQAHQLRERTILDQANTLVAGSAFTLTTQPRQASAPLGITASDFSTCEFNAPVYQVRIDITPFSAAWQTYLFRDGFHFATLQPGVTFTDDFPGGGGNFFYEASHFDGTVQSGRVGTAITLMNPCGPGGPGGPGIE